MHSLAAAVRQMLTTPVLLHRPAEVSTKKRYAWSEFRREYSEVRVRLRYHALLVIAECAIELQESARELSSGTGSRGGSGDHRRVSLPQSFPCSVIFTDRQHRLIFLFCLRNRQPALYGTCVRSWTGVLVLLNTVPRKPMRTRVRGRSRILIRSISQRLLGCMPKDLQRQGISGSYLHAAGRLCLSGSRI
jgi:hypothetical protein